MNKFDSDLAQGKIAEHDVANYIGGEVIDGKCSACDIMVEVKWDKMALRTGNVAFEASFKGKPSGIAGTKAQLVFYRIGDEYFMCSTDKLREGLKGKRTIMGGDGRNSEIVLLPLTEFKQLFNYIFTCS